MSHRQPPVHPSVCPPALDAGVWLLQRLHFWLTNTCEYIATHGAPPTMSVWYQDFSLPPVIETCALQTAQERRALRSRCQDRIAEGLAGVILIFVADVAERGGAKRKPHLVLHGACRAGEQFSCVPLDLETRADRPRFRPRLTEAQGPVSVTETILSGLAWPWGPPTRGH
jgi:hypothetical protein